jgi:RNA polymerase sigma-70 factor (ECF subfamily)
MVGGMTDLQLLEQFATGDDEAAALAFEVIVKRHGPMVFRVCRRVLCDVHAAEDAFQATFLVLARKARTLTSRELLGNWLFGVAARTARKAKTMTARRHFREREGAYHRSLAVAEPPRDGTQDDRDHVLHEEIGRLPQSYREAVVVCYLEGRSQSEAATQLGEAESTIRGRLARARKLLGRRLLRRGVAPSGGLMMLNATADALAEQLPRTTARATARAALVFVNRGRAIDGVVSATARQIANGVLFTMRLYPSRTIMAMAAAVGLLAAGAGLVTQSAADAKLRDRPSGAGLLPHVELAVGEPPSSGDHPEPRLAQEKGQRKRQRRQESVEIDAELKKHAPGPILRAVPVSQDCMIVSYLPDWDHGEVDNLGLQNGGARVLVDWPAIPADEAAAPDRRFLIALYAREITSHPPAGPIYAFELLEGWRERTAWKTQPKHSVEPAATYKFEPDTGWKLFDVTSLARAQIKGGRTSHGVMLRFLSEDAMGDASLSGYGFVSREGADKWANRHPLLLVVKETKE